MILTRLPSGRRQSTIGLDSSTRRPTCAAIFATGDVVIVAESYRDALQFAVPLDVGIARPLIMMSLTVVQQQRTKRSIAYHVVSDFSASRVARGPTAQALSLAIRG